MNVATPSLLPAEIQVSSSDVHRTVLEPLVTVCDDGAFWLAWRCDDLNGPEGGIRARLFSADGSPRSGELIVARGSRGGFRLGGMVALAHGGAAVTWVGDEGLAWITLLEPTARTFRTNFLEACEGLPCIACVGDASEVLVAFASAERKCVVVQRVNHAGPQAIVRQGPAGSHQPAISSSGHEYTMIWRLDGALMVCRDDSVSQVAQINSRIKAHHPAVAHFTDGWLCAWIGEDTGKLSLFTAENKGASNRIADVWAPVDRPDFSAVAMTSTSPTTAVIAWREERGPRPAVYLRTLDRDGRATEGETRVSSRSAVALPGRVALATLGVGHWLCAYAERRDGVDAIVVRASR